MRESPRPVLLDGHGHTLRQRCFEKRLLRQDGTGYVELRNVTLTRGGSDGPGGAVATRGEIAVSDSKVKQNLAEEPGGGIMSQRRATIIRSLITGNLANDDGGGLYARRGGIQVSPRSSLAAVCAPAALAGEAPADRPSTLSDRVDDLQEEVESLAEDIEDLGEPVEEFELFYD